MRMPRLSRDFSAGEANSQVSLRISGEARTAPATVASFMLIMKASMGARVWSAFTWDAISGFWRIMSWKGLVRIKNNNPDFQKATPTPTVKKTRERINAFRNSIRWSNKNLGLSGYGGVVMGSL
jgi:hypothetical protein